MDLEPLTYFAPQLLIPRGIRDIGFYAKGLGAEELRRWSYEDGTIHVAELSINGAMFHLHEENHSQGHFEPLSIKGNTAIIGLFVNDVDVAIHKAINSGAILISPAQDYDYGYRQGTIKDPFGHEWLIQKKI